MSTPAQEIASLPSESAVGGIEIVESPALFPGACVLTRSGDGPFLDLKTSNPYDERQYVSVQIAADMARALGFISLPEAVELRHELASTEQALAEAIEALEQADQELLELKASVRKTLLSGAVEERVPDETRPGRRKEKLKLRPVPGRNAVDIGEEE